MTSHGIRDRVAIVGMGCTKFGDLYDKGADDLLLDAALAATTSAGLTTDDVDAFWLGTMASGESGVPLARALKARYKPVTRVENYCATGSDAFRNACFAVASGAYDVVMAVGVEKMKDTNLTGLRVGQPPNDGTKAEWTAPSMFGLLGPAYARKHGLDEEELRDALAHIASKNHANGVLNSRAQFRRTVSPEMVKSAPLVASGLGIYDCSGIADGAAAAVIVRSEDAHRYTDKPIFVRALALTVSPGTGQLDSTYDYTSIPEVVLSANEAYAQAGVEDPRAQLALAEVHDCFTPTELILMEDLGFADPGQGWKDVLSGAFDRDGVLPVNTDGGLKSFGHPIGASGLRMLFECWRQLRREVSPEEELATVAAGRNLALTHNLGNQPGEGVSFVGIVATEPQA